MFENETKKKFNIFKNLKGFGIFKKIKQFFFNQPINLIVF